MPGQTRVDEYHSPSLGIPSFQDDASLESYEYEEESLSSVEVEEIDAPSDIEESKRALRRMSLQINQLKSSNHSSEFSSPTGSGNHAINGAGSWMKHKGSFHSPPVKTGTLENSAHSEKWNSGDSSSRHSVFAAKTANSVGCSLLHPEEDDESIIEEEIYEEEVLEEDELEEEVLEEELDEFEVVEDEDAVYREVQSVQSTMLERRTLRVGELGTLEERSIETDLSMSANIHQEPWEGLISTPSNKSRESVDRSPSGDDIKVSVMLESLDISADELECGQEKNESVEKHEDDSDDDKDDSEGETDVDEDEPSPEDVKEAIIYIMKQEKPIDKGHLSPEQATRMMALPFEDQKQIMEHFELCDNAGDPICWNLLVELIECDENANDHCDDDESDEEEGMGENTDEGAELSRHRDSENASNNVPPQESPGTQYIENQRRVTDHVVDESLGEGDRPLSEASEADVLEQETVLDSNDDVKSNRSRITVSQHDEDESCDEVEVLSQETSHSSSEEGSGSCLNGSSFLNSDGDECDTSNDIGSVGSGFSLHVRDAECHSPVTYHDYTEAEEDEEYIFEVIDDLIPEQAEQDKTVRTSHLKTMTQVKKFRRERSGSI